MHPHFFCLGDGCRGPDRGDNIKMRDEVGNTLICDSGVYRCSSLWYLRENKLKEEEEEARHIRILIGDFYNATYLNPQRWQRIPPEKNV